MKSHLFIFLFSFALITISCKNKKVNSTAIQSPAISNELKATGILNNKTGLDGCSWVIKLYVKDKHGHEYLEPTNLHTFKIKLLEGKLVEVIYSEETLGSTCMVGTIVFLKQIKEL